MLLQLLDLGLMLGDPAHAELMNTLINSLDAHLNAASPFASPFPATPLEESREPNAKRRKPSLAMSRQVGDDKGAAPATARHGLNARALSAGLVGPGCVAAKQVARQHLPSLLSFKSSFFDSCTPVVISVQLLFAFFLLSLFLAYFIFRFVLLNSFHSFCGFPCRHAGCNR